MITERLVATVTFLLLGMNPAFAELSKQDTYDLGMKAYTYAYPMVLMDVTKDVSTNVAAPVGGVRFQAPVNQFANMSVFPDANFKDVVRPNADTLYSSAWLDLSKEPMILSVPDTKGRYYLMPMLSAWTDVFASPGKRTTGTKAQNFAITGPFWHGTLPHGVKEIKAPTNMVWILGRTQTNGTADYDLVQQMQKGFKLTPLSQWGKKYTPPTNLPVDSNIEDSAPVMQVEKMDAISFFKRFAALLKNNPPKPEDKEQVELLAKLGIKPGQDFDPSKLTSEQLDALNRAATDAQKQISENIPKIGVRTQGWNLTPIVGNYGTHFLERATIDYAGLGANLPNDAIYPTAFVDGLNQPLSGKNHYVLHFNKNNLPPVNAFWSLSMYDKDSFFVSNPLNRYVIGDRDKLTFNKDGSLDIYIQNDSPGKDKESNWLPAPAGKFNVTLRMYWPKENVLSGKWSAPGIQRIENN